MSLLASREAYRLWAPTYEAGNPVTTLEQELVLRLGPSPGRLRLLDAGCGTGWRLAEAGAASAVGVDLSPEMLEIGRANPRCACAELIEGDLRALPVPSHSFDLVWCRLAIGYLAELPLAFTELARAAAPGADVVVTEFHPAALAAGHRRTFRTNDRVHEVRTYQHSEEQLVAAAGHAGLSLRARAEAAIGPQVRQFYRRAGREDLYREHRGLPLVLGLRFTRDG
ncbi:MAG: methyltransferase domain-containing protein [Porphyrobacter sp.]|nr:methyltransferase domain-containing protein [Porphyrobacter sp.]